MAKDIAHDKKSKKDKKEKKEKRASTDGVSKSKKEKKEKRAKVDTEMVDALEAELGKDVESSAVADDVRGEEGAGENGKPSGALVPFAYPLAEGEKDVKKILRTVKKSAKSKTLRRGVKEVVKALRKSNPPSTASTKSSPASIVIIAADISPMDVISHIPVLCEDHDIPYVYIKSRAQLGEASATKRPTSVVMISKERLIGGKKKEDGKEEDGGDFEAAFGELVVVVARLVGRVRR